MGGYEDGHLARLQLIGRATHYFGRIALIRGDWCIARALNINKKNLWAQCGVLRDLNGLRALAVGKSEVSSEALW